MRKLLCKSGSSTVHSELVEFSADNFFKKEDIIRTIFFECSDAESLKNLLYEVRQFASIQ